MPFVGQSPGGGRPVLLNSKAVTFAGKVRDERAEGAGVCVLRPVSRGCGDPCRGLLWPRIRTFDGAHTSPPASSLAVASPPCGPQGPSVFSAEVTRLPEKARGRSALASLGPEIRHPWGWDMDLSCPGEPPVSAHGPHSALGIKPFPGPSFRLAVP